MSTTRVWVLGANGQLGRSLQQCNWPESVDVRAFGRKELDLTLPATIEARFAEERPDLVINAAAYTAVDAAETDRREAFRVNAEGPALLSRACAEAGSFLVHTSTDYVFDGSKDGPYREDDETAPLGVYGLSKLEGERNVAAGGAQHLIVRTSWVYSPFGKNFVKTMLALSERDELSVVDDQRGCPTSALDLAHAIVQATPRLLQPDAPTGVVHLAGQGSTTWFGFAQAIFAEFAARGRHIPELRPITTAHYPTPARRPANSVLDSSRARTILGVELPAWQTGLSATLERLLDGDKS